MDKYIYDGPVLEFDRLLTDHWRAETMAVSKSKAMSNFKYQYKKDHNRLVSSNISLPGEIKLAN